MRVGLVGCGGVGAKRAAAIRMPHKLAMVADLDRDRAARVAESAGAVVASSWQDLVAARLDAVIVSTPPDRHAEIAVAALAAGSHVLVEKPAGRTLAEARSIAEAAAEAGRVACAGYNHRFHPAIMMAENLVAGAAIGTPWFVRGHYGHGGRIGYEAEWRFDRDRSGGGETIDQGAHLIDLARLFLGDLTLAYGAAPSWFWKPGIDDNCFLSLTGRRGRLAWVHASWTEWKNAFEFEVVGGDGKLVVTGLGGSYGPERLAEYRMRPELGPPDTLVHDFPSVDDSWRLEFDAFAAAASGKRSRIATLADAMAVLTIVGDVYAREQAR